MRLLSAQRAAPPLTLVAPRVPGRSGGRRQRQRQRHQPHWQAADDWPPVSSAAASASSDAASGASVDQPDGSSNWSPEAEGWQGAQAGILVQQAAGLAPPYPLDQTRQIVETAMLAAVTALAYTLGNLLRIESYLAYVLPLPVVLAAMRSGPLPALKTLTTAVLLLLILMGPVRATTYLLVYGVLSLSLGACWAWRLPWALSIPLGALARIAGYLAYIAVSSWVTNENLLQLMLTNIYALLDQLSAVLGTTGSPPLLAVVVVLCSLLFVNSLMYVALMHVLYAVILRGMGLTMHRMPKFAERLVGRMPAI